MSTTVDILSFYKHLHNQLLYNQLKKPSILNTDRAGALG